MDLILLFILALVMIKSSAAIDIGTLTARLLIASNPGPSGYLRALTRRREYIRLSQGIENTKQNSIQPAAINRTIDVLKEFLNVIKKFDVLSVNAIATGVIRQAANGDEFLEQIFKHTGIRARIVSGDEEARLTAKGVFHSLNLKSNPLVIFDLGGGSTEFFLTNKDGSAVKSIPLGASVLTNMFLKSDPPEDTEIIALQRHINYCLEDLKLLGDHCKHSYPIVGTGGTITALTLMIHEKSEKELTPELINGLLIGRLQLESLFNRIIKMNLKQRLQLRGLDEGRAGVIVAGTLVVICILNFFRAMQLTVSMSDLLEGILIGYFDGGCNGK